MLDRFVELEGHPEVVQFYGGEPTIHPYLLEMIVAAQRRDITHVMVNTNGLRIANNPEWFERFAALRPLIYLQFDGLTDQTYRTLRGEPLLETKLRSLDRLAEADLHVILVAAIERDVNEREVGPLVEFGLKHPAVRGVMFQPVTHTGRHPGSRPAPPDDDPGRAARPRNRWRDLPDERLRADPVLLPDLQLGHLRVPRRRRGGDPAAARARGRPVPRLHHEPYAAEHRHGHPPRPRGPLVRRSVPGNATSERFVCAACNLDLPALANLARRVFMVQMRDFLDPWTFDVKKAMKCCIGILQDDGRMIPFCTYNTVGYREETRQRLAARRRGGRAIPVLEVRA